MSITMSIKFKCLFSFFINLIALGSAFVLFQMPNKIPSQSLFLGRSLRISIGATQRTNNNDTEYVKRELARKQAEYEQRQQAEANKQAKTEQSSEKIERLLDLEFIQYIDSQGKINDVLCKSSATRATAFAVFDGTKRMQYCGQTRDIGQSLRLILARKPELTHFVKVQHITTPSRRFLEIIKSSWIEENGETPPGNDDGPIQASWESPLDVNPLMSDEDKANIEEAKIKGRVFEDAAIKAIARRFEEEKIKVLKERGVTENLRFDPKLKSRGLLDLHCPKPQNKVPSSRPLGKKGQ